MKTMFCWYSIIALTLLLKSDFCDASEYIRPGLPRLDVTFDGGKRAVLGNELTSTTTSTKPRLNWNASPSELYTVMMIDVDAPSRKDPFLHDYLHWLVVNIPGSHLKYGDELAPYMGPHPPSGTGFHRYYLLLYRQLKAISSKRVMSRAHFDPLKFAFNNELGKPIAGNYFKAQYDG